uniref:Uncharacterized protein n=1 Tax=Theileria annulata TaxID=5874 RepID=A0A3B0MQI4_THEAN
MLIFLFHTLYYIVMKHVKTSLLTSGSVYNEECLKFMDNLVSFAKECCGLDASKSFNRVDLKKSILNATRSKSLTKFIQTLSINDKKNLLNLSSMECPVICPSKKMILPPIESMPSNIMKSSKKLRNFFGIPELQVCRGCVKRGRCRRYQQVERGVPDLSDLGAVMIGMYSICKIHLNGNDLIVSEFAFRELFSVNSVLNSLKKYFKDFNIETNIPRGDDTACLRELRRAKRDQERKKLELLKEKGYNITPKRTTYMTSFQRSLYNKLYGKGKRVEEEFVWVQDLEDNSIPDENSKLEKINKAEIDIKSDPHHLVDDSYSNIQKTMDKIEDLDIKDIQFRMEYSEPLGTETNLVRYDVMNDKNIEGIKINSRGKFVVDLDRNLRNRDLNDLEYKNHEISMYKVPNTKKLGSLSRFIDNLDSYPNDLSFLKRVPYNYKCQSSGETLKPKGQTILEDKENLEQIALALESKQNFKVAH